MWKPEHRQAANRSGLRYPSDLTDAEWVIVAPMIPPGRHGGRKRSVNVREVLNGIFYILWTGCQWKALPKDLPPKSTVHDYPELWNWDGTLERIRMPQQADQRMATVPAGARIGERLARHRAQPECVVEFTVCQQSGIGRDHGAAKLQHQTAVEIELENLVV